MLLGSTPLCAYYARHAQRVVLPTSISAHQIKVRMFHKNTDYVRARTSRDRSRPHLAAWCMHSKYGLRQQAVARDVYLMVGV